MNTSGAIIRIMAFNLSRGTRALRHVHARIECGADGFRPEHDLHGEGHEFLAGAAFVERTRHVFDRRVDQFVAQNSVEEDTLREMAGGRFGLGPEAALESLERLEPDRLLVTVIHPVAIAGNGLRDRHCHAVRNLGIAAGTLPGRQFRRGADRACAVNRGAEPGDVAFRAGVTAGAERGCERCEYPETASEDLPVPAVGPLGAEAHLQTAARA